MEVEDVASTDTMVGAEGASVCVMVGRYMIGKVDQMSTFLAEISQGDLIQPDDKVVSQTTPFVQRESVVLVTLQLMSCCQ